MLGHEQVHATVAVEIAKGRRAPARPIRQAALGDEDEPAAFVDRQDRRSRPSRAVKNVVRAVPVDVGDREDNLPLTPVGRMPIPAKIAAALAAAILIVTALLGLLLLII